MKTLSLSYVHYCRLRPESQAEPRYFVANLPRVFAVYVVSLRASACSASSCATAWRHSLVVSLGLSSGSGSPTSHHVLSPTFLNRFLELNRAFRNCTRAGFVVPSGTTPRFWAAASISDTCIGLPFQDSGVRIAVYMYTFRVRFGLDADWVVPATAVNDCSELISG